MFSWYFDIKWKDLKSILKKIETVEKWISKLFYTFNLAIIIDTIFGSYCQGFALLKSDYSLY